jgi:hypothetical protein
MHERSCIGPQARQLLFRVFRPARSGVPVAPPCRVNCRAFVATTLAELDGSDALELDWIEVL